MTDAQFAEWMKLQTRQTAAAEAMAETLAIIARCLRDGAMATSMPPPTPAIVARRPAGK